MAMSSCTDDNDPIPTDTRVVTASSSKINTPLQARAYLSSRSWKLAKLKFKGIETTIETDSNDLDYVYTFRSDSSCTAYGNSPTNTSNQINGNWKLLNDNTLVIRYKGDTKDFAYKLQSIDASTYVIVDEDYEYTYVEIK
jgi:hypothetical protein